MVGLARNAWLCSYLTSSVHGVYIQGCRRRVDSRTLWLPSCFPRWAAHCWGLNGSAGTRRHLGGTAGLGPLGGTAGALRVWGAMRRPCWLAVL
jgi:hypothetical protein